jgi:hypothetical protein
VPAVELNHLREQIARVVAVFDHAGDFRRALTSLLELYTNHAYRAGQEVPTRPLLPSYHLPPLVIRQVEIGLVGATHRDPLSALLNSDALWSGEYLELRSLAALMLGQVHLSQAEGVLERLHSWAVPDANRQALELLLTLGTFRLRREGPDALIDLVREWAADPRPEVQAIGLKALLPLVGDEEFHNLPPVFNVLSPVLQNPSQQLYNDIQEVLASLIRRAPSEAAFFIRQMSGGSRNPDLARLCRRVVPLFPEDFQAALRTTLRERPASEP